MSVLKTERLHLRPPEPADAAEFVAYYTSTYRGTHGERLDEPTARQEFARVCRHWDDKGFGRFMVCLDGDDIPLGLIGPHHPDGFPEPELTWQLWSPTRQGKGIAFEAARAARAFARDVLGWSGAVSYIREENARSRRLAERLGATLDPTAPSPVDLGPRLVYRHRLDGSE